MDNPSTSLGSADGLNPSCDQIPGDMLSMFFCNCCNAVLGDGLSVCENNDAPKCIAFLRVTKHVKVNATIEYSLNGDLEGCAYHPLSCEFCKTNVGLLLHSATRQCAYLLQMFCLFKDQISCYLFKTQKVVEGNNLHFDFSRCGKLLNKLQNDICKTHYQIELLSAKRPKLQESPESPSEDSSY